MLPNAADLPAPATKLFFSTIAPNPIPVSLSIPFAETFSDKLFNVELSLPPPSIPVKVLQWSKLALTH